MRGKPQPSEPEATSASAPGATAPRIAVVIPTLDEEQELWGVIHALREAGRALEIVVVDGGSSDRTVELAQELGVRVLVAPRGRAYQQNAGARATSGDPILFLHADARLGPAHLASVGRTLRDPDVVGGSFPIRIDDARWSLRIISWVANLRTRLDRTPYGDQAIFVRRSAFVAAGGFPEAPILEDLLLGRRLRALGRFAFPAGPPLRISARRWQSEGVLRVTLRNWAARLLFEVGMPLGQIRRLYDWGARRQAR